MKPVHNNDSVWCACCVAHPHKFVVFTLAVNGQMNRQINKLPVLNTTGKVCFSTGYKYWWLYNHDYSLYQWFMYPMYIDEYCNETLRYSSADHQLHQTFFTIRLTDLSKFNL